MAEAASVHDYVMYDYVTQLQAATQRVSADGLRCLRRLVVDLESYVGEAFSNSEAILTPPPACFLPEPGERDRMLHVNFGILWSSMKCQEPDAAAVAAEGGSSVALQSPPKRPRTLIHEEEQPARPPLAEAAALPATAQRDKAVFAKEASATSAKVADKISEKAAERIARQGPLAAPSPCRAQRQGLMASSPPRAPPPVQQQALEQGWGLKLEEAAPEAPPEPAPPASARSFAAPASFAMPSTRAAVAEECLSPATPLDFSASNAWQGSALFAPPPPSPAPELGGQASAPAPAPLPPSPAPPPLPLPLPLPSAASAASAAPAAEREQPQQPGEGTPVPVSQRIKMFETRSTPCLGQPAASHAAPSSSQGRMRNGVAVGSNSQLVNGNSMFTPLRSSACGVKPKELFRSHSEFARGGKQAPPSSARSAAPLRPPTATASAAAGPGVGLDKSLEAGVRACDRVEAFERLAAGSKREDVARPKSLKAAEVAKLQEERRLREKQERERTRGLGTSASASTLGATSSAPPSARRPQPPQPPSTTGREPPAAAATRVPEDPPAPIPPAAPAGGGVGGSAQKAVDFPPVPAFAPEPHVLLRQLELPPKREEDNYAVSDNEHDSEDEHRKSPDRSLKYVPKWCESYLEDLKAQADMDPDTLFASRVPRCDLDAIFTDELYREVGKNRPKRMRGSSGDWRKDRLTCSEIKSYKSRMGHVRSWDVEKDGGKEKGMCEAGMWRKMGARRKASE